MALALSGVAQLAERRTVNPQVVGSSPTPGATNMQVRAGLSGLALCASGPLSHQMSQGRPFGPFRVVAEDVIGHGVNR